MKTCPCQYLKPFGLVVVTALSLFVCGLRSASAAAVAQARPNRPVQLSVLHPAVPVAARRGNGVHGLLPGFHIPSRWLWLGYPGIAVLLGLVGYGFWEWKQRSRRQKERLPHELALERLEAARGLMQPAQARDFSVAVSEVVRHYIEQRFLVRAERLTTWEFLQDLAARADSPLAGYRVLLGDFLYHCDLARFARWLLSVQEMGAMLQSARRFVRETGVVEGPAQTSATPSHREGRAN